MVFKTLGTVEPPNVRLAGNKRTVKNNSHEGTLIVSRHFFKSRAQKAASIALLFTFGLAVWLLLAPGESKQEDADYWQDVSSSQGVRTDGNYRFTGSSPTDNDKNPQVDPDVASASEQGLSQPVIEIESVFDLIDQINAIDADLLDLDVISDYVANSSEAFDYVSTEYLITADPELKDKLRIIIDNVALEEKTDLALQLVSSEQIDDQQTGYRWLISSEQAASPEVYNTLIDALDQSAHTTFFPQIITSLNGDSFAQDEPAKQRLISRLKALTEAQDHEIARSALSKAVELSPDADMLNILQSHITYGEADMQAAAIQELKHFSTVNAGIISELNNIMHNPSAPQHIRQATVRTVVELENAGVIAP